MGAPAPAAPASLAPMYITIYTYWLLGISYRNWDAAQAFA